MFIRFIKSLLHHNTLPADSVIFSEADIESLKGWHDYTRKTIYTKLDERVYYVHIDLPKVIISIIRDYIDIQNSYRCIISSYDNSCITTITSKEFNIEYYVNIDTKLYRLHLYDIDSECVTSSLNKYIDLSFDVINSYMMDQYNVSFCRTTKRIEFYKSHTGDYCYIHQQVQGKDVIIIKDHYIFNKIMLICKMLYDIT